jgi:hypothetical protein
LETQLTSELDYDFNELDSEILTIITTFMEIVTYPLWSGDKPLINEECDLLLSPARHSGCYWPSPKHHSSRLPRANSKEQNAYVTFSPRSRKNLKFCE